MFSLVAVALMFDLAPQCVSSGDTTTCGYHCVTSTRSAVCAQTSSGVCASVGGRAACFDPPPDVRWLLYHDDSIERPTCVASLREIACGFHCLKMLDGRVRCAQTPQGACQSNQSAVTCWDPSEEVRWRMLQSRRIENADCVSYLDHVVCGYHCTSVGTSLACAASPWGMCQTHFTRIACFDPAFDEVAAEPSF